MSWSQIAKVLVGSEPPPPKRAYRNRDPFTLTTGEIVIYSDLYNDPRNIHKISPAGLRARIDRGARDPAEIFRKSRSKKCTRAKQSQ